MTMEFGNGTSGSPLESRQTDQYFRELMKGVFPEVEVSPSLSDETLSELTRAHPLPVREIPATFVSIPEERNIAPILVIKVKDKTYIRAEQFSDPQELRMKQVEVGQILDEKLGDVLMRVFQHELERVGINGKPEILADGIISRGRNRITALLHGSVAPEVTRLMEKELTAAFPDKRVSIVTGGENKN